MFISRPGNLEKGFRNYLEYIKSVFNREDIKILEIGSFLGDSSELFKIYFPNSYLFCVDPWLNGYDEEDDITSENFPLEAAEIYFDIRMKKYKNVFKIKMCSDDFFNFFSIYNIMTSSEYKVFDVIYIDGNHRYEQVKKDISNSIRLIKGGGILSGHDYNLHLNRLRGVVKAVNEFFIPDMVFDDTTWIKHF